MKYDFDSLPDRRASESVKWHVFEDDVLPMWVADMDFLSPQPVIRALQERVAQGVFGYPTGSRPDDLPELHQAIVDWLASHYQWQVQPADLVFLPGVVTGFNLLSHALAVPGGGVLVQTPVYEPILKAAHNTGAQPAEMALTLEPGGTYSYDQPAFEAAFNAHTRLFILCNPHNPVGRVFRRDELESMADVCLRNGVVICSDEIHCDLVYSGHQHIPIASLDPEVAQNTITLMAPSKTFNIAGLQFSFAVIPNPELRERFRRSGKGLLGWVNLMGLTAAQAAYQEGQEWLDQLMLYLEGNRDFVYSFVQQELPGIGMAKPEGTYLAWLDCRQAENLHCAQDPFRFFLHKARVGLNNGLVFGEAGRGFVRLNFGCPRFMLADALERMKQSLID